MNLIMYNTSSTPLVEPVLTGCFTTEEWESLFCEWEPKDQGPNVVTTVKAIVFCDAEYNSGVDCFHISPGRCELNNKNEFLLLKANYRFNICVSHSTSNASKCYISECIMSDLLEKPLRIVDVSLIGQSSRWVELQLKRSKTKEVIYHVVLKGSGKILTMNYTKPRFLLEGLKPRTNYSLTVTCKMVKGSIFSDQYTFEFQTKSEVPEENPQLIPGSYNFDSSVSPDGKSYVHIFWKKVPYECENGKMNTTGITCYEYPLKKDGGVNGEIRTEKSDPNEAIVQLKWQLNRSKDYMVEITSYNEVGSNELIQPSRLIIPSTSRAPKSPEHIYATLVNNSIHLKWSEVEDADNYTVYWCHLHHSTRKCQTNRDIEWNSCIPPGITEMIIPSSDNLNLRVGISVEKFDFELDTVVSSGLNWAHCIHKDNADVLPPQDLQFSPLQHPHSLTIMWSHPECSAGSYVSSYEVFWCKRKPDYCDTKLMSDCCMEKSSKTLPRVLTEWTLNDLDINSEYEVAVASISFNKVSPFKNVLAYKWPNRGLLSGIYMVVVVIVLLLIAVFVIFLSGFLIRMKRYREQTPLNITLPSASHSEYGPQALNTEYSMVLMAELSDICPK